MAPEPNIQPAGVVIPLNDIYREVQATRTEMHTVSTKLNSLHQELKAINDHETRLRSLERKVWGAAGGAAAIAAVLTKIVGTFTGV